MKIAFGRFGRLKRWIGASVRGFFGWIKRSCLGLCKGKMARENEIALEAAEEKEFQVHIFTKLSLSLSEFPRHTASVFFLFQGENGDLKNRPQKMDINHVSIPLAEKASADYPDSSIGDGMELTIQGANGHVKHNNDPNGGGGAVNGNGGIDTASLKSHDSQDRGKLKLPKLAEEKQEYSSDMSIGRGMDISITGEK